MPIAFWIIAGEVHGGAARRVLLEAMMALDDLDVEALALETPRLSATSLKSKLTTRLMLGENRTAVAWAAASISLRWSSVCPVVATTTGILRASHVLTAAIVPSGTEKSISTSGAR